VSFQCPHCKNFIDDDDALLCLYCGEGLGRSVGVMGALRHPRSKWIFISIILLVILSFLLLSGCASAEGRAEASQGQPPAGERLTYSIKWVGLPVGSITTLSKGDENLNGRKVYVFEADVRIGGIVSVFFGAKVHFVSYVDVATLGVVRTMETRRGHGDKDVVTDFDRAKKKAVVKDLRRKTEKTFDITPDMQDILSACFLMRQRPFKVGDRISYDVFHGEQKRHYLFWVSGRTKREFLAHPYAREEGGMLDRGRVDAYFADDAVRTPRRAIVRGPVFGHVTITLARNERT
jgi:hypothetical protein